MRQDKLERAASGPSAFRLPPSAFGAPCSDQSRRGFTLVELLVVIAIIALLSSLLLVAAQSALRAAARAQIGAQLEQLNTAIEDYKNNKQSYPPNAQTGDAGLDTPARLDKAGALTAFQRHFLKAFPDHREPDSLIRALVGQNTAGASGENLEGGMNAAEALVFWIGGFSDDPKYPITGPGGPSYSISTASLGGIPSNEADPIESRSWALDINVSQLGPRNDSNFFDTTDARFVEYQDPRTPNDATARRRIQFWYLKAPSGESPYVYFDASRSSSPDQTDDVPGATTTATFSAFDGPDSEQLNQLFDIHAVKSQKPDASAVNQYQFANNKKFQILHPGIDDIWGVLPRVQLNPADTAAESAVLVNTDNGTDLNILFPTGPWSGDLLETLSNFTDGRLEDAAP